MTLGVACEIIGSDILDGTIVDMAGRDQPVGNQTAQDVRRVFVELVIIGRHTVTPARRSFMAIFCSSVRLA